MLRRILIPIMIIGMFILAGCKSEGSGSECIDKAKSAGRNAARVFISREWKDTMDLQRQLLEVRAKSSEYRLAGKDDCAAAFDSAFVGTIRTVRPDIWMHIKE